MAPVRAQFPGNSSGQVVLLARRSKTARFRHRRTKPDRKRAAKTRICEKIALFGFPAPVRLPTHPLPKARAEIGPNSTKCSNSAEQEASRKAGRHFLTEATDFVRYGSASSIVTCSLMFRRSCCHFLIEPSPNLRGMLDFGGAIRFEKNRAPHPDGGNPVSGPDGRCNAGRPTSKLRRDTSR